MKEPVIYRRRLIPDECIPLDKDRVLSVTSEYLITEWKTIRPKKDLSHGVSAYFWDKGVKVSKFYDHDNKLMCWYCDIITHDYDAHRNSITVLDLLADVLVYPDGSVKVVDLDELADASEKGLLPVSYLQLSLRTTDALLKSIYNGEFQDIQRIINEVESTKGTV